MQLNIFEMNKVPAQNHSQTSIAAAEAIYPYAATLKMRVLQHLRGYGDAGRTDEEMQDDLDMNPSTQRPRRCELVADGLVKKAGFTRATKSKRQAAVWLTT